MIKLYTVTITYKDDKGSKSRSSFNYPGTASIEQLTAFIEDYLTRADQVAWGSVESVSVALDLNVTFPARQSPDLRADKEEVMKGKYITLPGLYTDINVPTWRDDLTRTYTQYVKRPERRPDLYDTDVQAYFNLILAAGLFGHPSNPCDSRGKAITGARKRVLKFRRS